MEDQSSQPGISAQRKAFGIAILVVCSLVGFSAVWGMYDAVQGKPRVWGLLGFEVVTVIAAVIGIFVGLGRPREAPGLAAVSLGATIFAASTLGRFSAIVTRAESALSERQAVGQLVRDPIFEGRLVAAVILLVIAACLALGNDRVAWRKLILGIVLMVPVLVSLLGLQRAGLDWLLAPVESFPGLLRVVGVFIGSIGIVIAASVSIHLVIRAFEDRLPPLGVGGTGGASGVVSGLPAGRNSGEANPTKPA